MADLRSRSTAVPMLATLNSNNGPTSISSSSAAATTSGVGGSAVSSGLVDGIDIELQQRERLLCAAEHANQSSSGGRGSSAASTAEVLLAAVPSSSSLPGVDSSSGTAASKMSRYADMVGYKRISLFHELGSQKGLAGLVDSNLKTGINSASVALRISKYGRNVLPTPEPQSLWDFIKEALEDKTLLILIGAAVVSLVLGMTTPDPRTGEVDRSTGWIEGFAILLSVAIVTLIGSVNNYQKQNQFACVVESADKLRAVPVVRDGLRIEVDNNEIVVGDIVRLYGGMTFSFDAVLVEGDGFACDESNLTGEADRVPKTTDTDPFLLSGTSVTDGCEGVALVVAVGVSSFSGAIHSAVCEEKKDQTPLQEKLEGMADTIGKFGLVAAIITFVILTLKEMFHIFVLGHTFYAMKIFENITTAVAIVVVAVPEGLPLSVTISLAYSMKRMLQDKNLVRHLAACETMGGATTICTDKTGTLTMSDMYLRALYLGGSLYDNLHTHGITVTDGPEVHITSPSSLTSPLHGNKEGGLASPQFSSPRLINSQGDWDLGSTAPQAVVHQLLDCVAHNTVDVLGTNKTTKALSVVVDRLKKCYGYDAAEVARSVGNSSSSLGSSGGTPSPSSSSARVRFPFSSANKRSSVVVKTGNQLRHYVIGAAELVLQSCTHVYTASGSIEPLTGALREKYEAASTAMMSGGLRTLALAVSERTTNWGELPSSPPDEPLRLIGFAGIEEPLRPEVPKAIATSYAAGIRVMMLTGDSLPTAVNIAKRCGIHIDDKDRSGATVMEGSVFRSLSDREIIAHVLPKIAVLARASPLDKRRIVHLLKMDPNEVVAVTGDGTNDAPALKAADVGFAMNSGSDVAKRASDIVLLDDNYVGMVKATMWGRNVKANIRKFIQFQLTVNVAACIVAIIGAVLNSQNLSPLKPVQLLWLNLIMDTLAALALATELPSRCLLERGVEKKETPIVTPAMWLNIATQSTFQLITQMILLLGADNYFGVKEFSEDHLALVFNVFVMMQIFNFFNARLLSGDHSLFFDLHKSQFMLAIVAAIFISQIFIMQFAGRFFSVKPLDLRKWLVSIGIGSLSLPIGAVTRHYQRRKGMKEVGGGEDIVSFAYEAVMNAYARVARLVRPRRRGGSAE